MPGTEGDETVTQHDVEFAKQALVEVLPGFGGDVRVQDHPVDPVGGVGYPGLFVRCNLCGYEFRVVGDATVGPEAYPVGCPRCPARFVVSIHATRTRQG